MEITNNASSCDVLVAGRQQETIGNAVMENLLPFSHEKSERPAALLWQVVLGFAVSRSGSLLLVDQVRSPLLAEFTHSSIPVFEDFGYGFSVDKHLANLVRSACLVEHVVTLAAE